jgi:uncharacterized RDD family membrane protein YckC
MSRGVADRRPVAAEGWFRGLAQARERSMSYQEDPEFNPYAPPKVDLVFDEFVPVSEFAGYAGFWQRFLAYVIDYILTRIVSVSISFAVQFGLMSGLGARDDRAVYVAVFSFGISTLLSIAVTVAYWAGMECSASQATLGKMAVGIKVTDLYGRRITFWRSLGRTCGKFVSQMTLMVGYVMAAFTDRRQALHDMIASTLVIKVR